jgi:hypothetical protein
LPAKAGVVIKRVSRRPQLLEKILIMCQVPCGYQTIPPGRWYNPVT